MKKILQFVLAGVATAVGGAFFSELCGKIFNGMDYGSATVFGICIYLCVVIVARTGIIISRLDKSTEGRGHVGNETDL